MFQLSVLALGLWGGIIEGPFRIAGAEPEHHQVHLRAAMASDGRFAIAWVDSLYLNDPYVPNKADLNLFVRFFDSTGNPLTDAYKIPKLADTNWIYHPRLDMDSLGNTALVWIDDKTESNEQLSNIRFQAFGPGGTPMAPPKTLYSQVDIGFATPISLASNGEFAMVFMTRLVGRGSGTWVQRFDLEGVPKDSAFLAHVDLDSISDTLHLRHPQVALNDAGDLVVTWLETIETPAYYPRFQAFDANDEPILPWEPTGYRLDDGAEKCGACRPEPHWLDNDRFVAFWTDYMVPPYTASHLLGRIFSDKGVTRHIIHWLIWKDSLRLSHGGRKGWYSTAVSPNDSFAYTHTRSYSDHPDTSDPSKYRRWDHGAGILGYIQDNEPIRRTNLFEYTPAWGVDTVNSFFNNLPHVQTSAVACCDDRLVWVYSRLNTDTIFEAYAMITDWDMGEWVEEQPIPRQVSHWELVTSIGPQIVLRYKGRPDGFHASFAVFDALGRKVDEIHTTGASGTITWGADYCPGVYFIKACSGDLLKAKKAIIVR